MIYIFLALIMYTIALMLGAAASRKANTNLAGAVNNLVAAIIPIAVVIPILSKKALQTQKSGLLLAALSGVFIGLFVLALSKSFSVNKVGIVTPIIFGGSILLTTILSYFIFKEKLTALESSGLFLLAVGMAIIIYARATTE